MSERLIIAIDCDDVLIPTAEAIIAAYNRDYGTNLQLKDFYSTARHEAWGTNDEKVAIDRVGLFLRSEEHARIKPDLEAIAAVGRLALKHELHLVTGRSDYLESITKAMLGRYFPECFTSIEHTNYFEGQRKRSKGEVCAQLKADVLIDDHIAHGESVLASGLKEVIVFGDYPWNQAQSLPQGMTRCADWQVTEEEIGRISHGR